ncbi:MAG: SGNH/GDSL hydrolase family protein [Sedimentisphaerales bacterium]|nr:SGNH/GDSL hydrolase family protein [Sedimentisphaerales bacterium]
MKRPTKKGCYRLVALGILVFGVLCNPWLIAFLFRDHVGSSIRPENKIFIWLFQGICILSGIWIYFKGGTPAGRKRIVFQIIMVFLMLIFVEGSLRIACFVLDIDPTTEKAEGFLTPDIYKKTPWAQQMFKEWKNIQLEYKPFICWDRREFHGQYVNVDSKGVRKTINPSFQESTQVKTLYMFGGSTTWGAAVRDEGTIPSHLSSFFHSAGQDMQVSNYGELGYVFSQEVIQLILLLKEGSRPDYVIFYDGVNDVKSTYDSGIAGTIQNLSQIRARFSIFAMAPPEQLWIGCRDTIPYLLRKHSMIYNAIRKTISHSLPQERYSEKQLEELAVKIVDHYMQTMVLVDHLAHEYGFQYLCFWQPLAFLEDHLTEEEMLHLTYRGNETLKKLYHLSLEEMRKRCPSKMHIVTEILSNRQETYYLDYCHLNEQGNRVVAQGIFNVLQRESFVK